MPTPSDMSQKVIKTKTTSAPRPTIKNSDKKEAPVTRFEPLSMAAVTKAAGIANRTRSKAQELRKKLRVCTVK